MMHEHKQLSGKRCREGCAQPAARALHRNAHSSALLVSASTLAFLLMPIGANAQVGYSILAPVSGGNGANGFNGTGGLGGADGIGSGRGGNGGNGGSTGVALTPGDNGTDGTGGGRGGSQAGLGGTATGGASGGGGGGGFVSLTNLQGGGGGGGGGSGISLSGTATIHNSSTIQGGDGGNGFQFNGVFGAGGGGGNGITLNASTSSQVVNNVGATIVGGNGGLGSTTPGAGGGGGDGISIAGNSVMITNAGVISGGIGGYAGGLNGHGVTLLGDNGLIANTGTIEGRSGIAVLGNRNTMINSGTLTGQGPTALSLNGQDNRLELWGGSTIAGLVVATGAGNVLAFGGPTDASFDTVLLGSGGQYIGFDLFEKTGSSTLTLFGNNSYSGATTVNQGTLRAGAVGSLSSVSALTVAAGAVLDLAGFDQEIGSLAGAGNVLLGSALLTTGGNGFSTTFSGIISGSGGLTKRGVGTLTLSGANSYTGATVVEGGILRAGAVNAFAATGTTTVAVGATLDLAGFNQRLGALAGAGTVALGAGTLATGDNNASTTFAGSITGSGGLTKRGISTLTLSGVNSYTGPTAVGAGRLVVNGALASSVALDGGLLGGTGTVGSLSVLSSGTVAPGNSIGTLNVSGNVSFTNGSVYALEVDKVGRSDKIAATGVATLSGGTVQVLADQGTGYVENSPYLILTARNGVTGKFAGTSGGNFAFVTPTLGYSGDTVTLTLVRKTDPIDPTDPTDPDKPSPTAFHIVAETINQYRTADAVEALGTSSRLYSTVLGASVDAARQAFDALSGEAHASAVSVAYEDNRLVREAILTRLRQGSSLPTLAQGSYDAAYAADVSGAVPQAVPMPGPSLDPRRFALWGEGFGSWGKVASNGNAASLDTSTGGFILGADAALDPVWRLGFAGGFARTSFDIDGRLSSGTNDSIFGALYGSGSWDAVTLRFGAAYAWHDFDIQRHVQFPSFSDTTSTSYNGWSAQAFAELGYRVDLAGGQLEPFIGASVLRLHTDAFREEGGAAALTGLGQDQDLATTTLGLRAEARLSADLPLTLRGLVGWRHAYGDVEPESLLAFAGGASTFTVAGAPLDRDALVAEAGLDWQASEAISLGVAYFGQIGERAQEHSVKGSFVWRFGTH